MHTRFYKSMAHATHIPAQKHATDAAALHVRLFGRATALPCLCTNPAHSAAVIFDCSTCAHTPLIRMPKQRVGRAHARHCGAVFANPSLGGAPVASLTICKPRSSLSVSVSHSNIVRCPHILTADQHTGQERSPSHSLQRSGQWVLPAQHHLTALVDCPGVSYADSVSPAREHGNGLWH